MSKTKIVHISKTPLVKAPCNLSFFLNAFTKNESVHFILKDYPGNKASCFTAGSIVLDRTDKLLYDYYLSCLQKANIIHIHNDVDSKCVEEILDNTSCPRFIYQVHSPTREPPLFCDRSKVLPFSWYTKLSIAHVHPRMYHDFRIVPNIIPSFGVPPHLYAGGILKVLFSPASMDSDLRRFSLKTSRRFEEILSYLSSDSRFSVSRPLGMVKPEILLKLRELFQVTIDEIQTGGFHQISCEGLSCGNIVINGADYFAIKGFANSIRASEPPPFLVCDEDNFYEQLFELKQNVAFTNQLQRKSYEYFQKFLLPSRLIKIFDEIYRG